MGKHNYSQYSNKNTQHRNNQQMKPVEKAPMNEVKTEVSASPEIKMVQETVKTVTLPELVKGTVVRCAKLNVREKPIVSSDIVCVLNAMSEIAVDPKKSTTNWFYVICVTGAEGYCMREYIDARV